MRRNPLIRKLECFATLPEADKMLLERATANPRDVKAHRDLIREGDTPHDVFLVVEGFACRYKMLSDGRRQIMAYLLPGDLDDRDISILDEMDHSIGTLSACKVVQIPRETVKYWQEHHPALARALRWAALVDEAISREWLANIGRRPADRRIAHLLCELLLRLQAVGLATENSYDLPLTQDELADTTGLSVVHVNRVLQGLRGEKLIGSQSRRLDILDVEGLKAYAEFNPNYLHLKQGAGKELRLAEGARASA